MSAVGWLAIALAVAWAALLWSEVLRHRERRARRLAETRVEISTACAERIGKAVGRSMSDALNRTAARK